MTDYIKREDAEYALVSHFMPQTYTGEEVDQAFHLAKSIMSDVPSADVAPVHHGRWITEPYMDNFITCRCSECMTASAVTSEDNKSRFNYCPNCGAKMDEEVEE